MSGQSNNRAAINPAQVRPLDLDQVRSIVAEAFPELIPDEELVSDLLVGINSALETLAPRLDNRGMSDVDDIHAAFRKLGKKLTSKNLRLLAELGSAHLREIDLLSAPRPAPAKVAKTLEMFELSFQLISQWLDDRSARGVISGRTKSLANERIVAGHLLPDTFQMNFKKKFGNGLTGPGPRFVAAVLREAGIRSAATEEEKDTTAAYIRKARQMMLKQPASPSKRQSK
jgi:hypothetical protein